MPLHRIAIVAVSWVLFATSSAIACGFIQTGLPPTIRERAETSHVVLFGRLENARGTSDKGSTDFVILKTLKANPVLAGKNAVTIPRYLSTPDPKNPPLYLVIGDVKDGKLDFYEGSPATPAFVEYAQGVLALDPKDRVKLMRHCFDSLEHEDAAIAADAFGEFMKSTDPEISKAAKTLTPDKLRRWLQAERTAPDRLRLYAFLLANCGTRDDAVLLCDLLDKLMKRDEPPQMDGIVTAYTLLDPKAGWALACEMIQDKRFPVSYSALRAARYFHLTQPEALPESERLRVIRLALANPEIADLPIEYLREWKCWKLTDDVLTLVVKPAYKIPIVRRSIIRYAIQCPGPEAAKHVEKLRKTDPERVKFIEETLKDEAAQKKQ